MDDNKMRIQASVDLPSAKQVNQQIRALEKSINKLKISGKLDETALKNLTKQLSAIKATVSTVGFSPTALKDLSAQIQKALNKINFSASFDQELDRSLSQLSRLKEKWINQGIYVEEFRGKVEMLEKSLHEISIRDIKGLNTLKEQITSLSLEASNLSKIQEIRLFAGGEIENDYDTQFAKLESSFARIGLTGDELQSKTSGVTAALSKLRERLAQPFDESNYAEIILLNQKLQDEFIESRNESERMNAAMQTAAASSTSINADQIQKLADDNANALKKYSDSGITAIEKLKSAFDKLGGKKLFNNLFGIILQQLKRIPKEVAEIDAAMTRLYKATDETDIKYRQFLDSASDSAQKLGRSISSLVEQTTNWSKLGFDLDTSAKLAEISSLYANVGEIDDATAISNLVTAMKAFNIEASDSIMIVDSLNKLGNDFATDAKSLGEGLKISASSMADAGNDIHQTLAILTGAGEINKNVDELSNGLRVVSLRLRGMKDELQSIGEEYTDIESISKIQSQISNLTNGSVNILKDDGSFKSTYDQLREISEIYFDLSDTARTSLTEILFGKSRASQGVEILEAFQSGQIQKAYEASVNSAGFAMEEQEKWLESLEAKTRQFDAAFQSLSTNILDSDLLKWFVDLGTSGVQALDHIIDQFGVLGTVGLGTGIFTGFKNVGSPKMFGPTFVTEYTDSMLVLPDTAV